ncbi:MAG: alpha/beta hydrolase [Litoreibacter sp.]|uniref:alpha/beta fold hydrolase n=1 Tax=Litoreibacter sp. TaxID=1969459 RepID=UPI00329A4D3C
MTLVFLPGMMCDARLFQPQLDAFPDSIVVTSTDFATITEMAQDVLAASPDRFDLLGLSMGGIIAMEVVRLAPERVSKIALLDTNHLAEKEAMRQARFPQIEAAQNGQMMDIMRNVMVPRYLASGGSNTDRVIDLCLKMASDLGAAAFVNQSHALMDRPDQSETLRNLTCPALVLCGIEDRLCPVLTHEEMAELIPQATLENVAGAGHLPTLEQPSHTNAAIARWLEIS